MPSVYRVSVAIAMSNGVSSVLKVIQKDVLGLNAAVNLTQGGLSRLKLAVVGAGAAFAGVGMLDGFKHLAGAGSKLLDQQQLMIANGTKQRDLAVEMAAAYGMVSIGGSSLVDNVRMIADLRQLLGAAEQSQAIALAPMMMKAGIAAGLMTNQDPERAAYNIALTEDNLGYTVNRATGQMDAARAAQQANVIDAIIAGTNGRVTTDMLLQFSKQGRTAARLLSDQGFMDMAPVIQAQGGYRAGTGLQAFDKAITGGVMTTRGTGWLESLGLLDPKNVHKGESGYTRLDPNAISGAAMSSLDPQAWANQYLLPALKKMVGPNGTLADMLKIIAQSGLANTTNGFLAELIGNSIQNAKDVKNIQTAAGTNQYNAQMQSASGAMQNFTTAIDGLMQALGLPAAKMGVTILNDLAGGIRNFTQWVGEHPAYAKAMDVALLGLGAALTVLGAAAVIGSIAAMVGSGGTIALVGLGLAALAGAFYELPGAIKDVETGFQDLLKFLGLAAASAPGDTGRTAGLHKPAASALTGVPLPAAIPSASISPPALTIHGSYGRHVPTAANDTAANNADDSGMTSTKHLVLIQDHLAAIHTLLGNGITTNIGNPKDIGDAAVNRVKRQMAAPNTGASGVNLRATPPGSAALATLGSGY